MSVHSHAPPAVKAPAPPYTQRRCNAYTNPGSMTKAHWVGGVWTVKDLDTTPRQCRMYASPWFPEGDYCSTHLPADAVALVRARMDTWAAVCVDFWAMVLAEHPYHHAD